MGQGHTAKGRIMKTLLLGSSDISTSLAHKKFNLPESVLVPSAGQDYTVGHTSRQEFNSDNELEQVLKSADVVLWAFPKASEFISEQVYYDTLDWLKQYHKKFKNVQNLQDIKLDPYNWKSKVPKLTDNDIVFIGSSNTLGVGLPSVEHRYANIVAKHFGKNGIVMQELFRTKGNNDKSIDIFSQCDFNPGQIVVLQSAPLMRIRYCNEQNKLIDSQLFSAENFANHRSIVDVFSKEFLFYRFAINMRLITQLARAKKLRFVFFLDDYKSEDITHKDQMCFYDMPEFLSGSQIANDTHVDLANDNAHPGVEANRRIAQHIIDHIEYLYK